MVGDESGVVTVESEGSVVSGGLGEAEENGSSGRPELEESGVFVGEDKSGEEGEGLSVTEGSKGDSVLEIKFPGGIADGGTSVGVSVDGSES